MSQLVAVSPARLAPVAAHAIRRAFNGKPNPMSPTVLGFATLGHTWAVEMSKGEGFRDRRTGECPDIYAVTVVGLDTFESVHALCGCFVSREAAMAYLGRLDRLATYRAARKSLVAAMVSARALCRRTANVVLFGAAYESQRVMRKSLAELRTAFVDVIASFGIEAPAELRTRTVPRAATMGGKVTAARMVAQPVQQAQARDTRAMGAAVAGALFKAETDALVAEGKLPALADLQPGLAIDRACLDCEPRAFTAEHWRAMGKAHEERGDLSDALACYSRAREIEAQPAPVAMVPQPVQQQQARASQAQAVPMPAPAHATEQDAYNAARIATATAFTAHIRYEGHPQTLTHKTRLGAGLTALIMHREIMVASPESVALPTLYAITPDGAGYLLRLSEWLPETLAHLARISAGTYEPHPAIARALAIDNATAARKAAA